MGLITQKILQENHWGHVMPTLDAAPRVSASSFRPGRPVNVAADAVDDWKIVPAAAFHERIACAAIP